MKVRRAFCWILRHQHFQKNFRRVIARAWTMEEHHGKAAWRSRTIDVSRASPLSIPDESREQSRSPTMSALKQERLGKLRVSMSPVRIDNTHPHLPALDAVTDDAVHSEVATMGSNSSQGQCTPPLPSSTDSPASFPSADDQQPSRERVPRRSSIRRSSSAVLSSARATSAPPISRSSTIVSFSELPPAVCSFDKSQPSAVIRGPAHVHHLHHERSPLGSNVINVTTSSSPAAEEGGAPVVRRHRRSSSLVDFAGIVE